VNFVITAYMFFCTRNEGMTTTQLSCTQMYFLLQHICVKFVIVYDTIDSFFTITVAVLVGCLATGSVSLNPTGATAACLLSSLSPRRCNFQK
jgi:hypothetical protein